MMVQGMPTGGKTVAAVLGALSRVDTGLDKIQGIFRVSYVVVLYKLFYPLCAVRINRVFTRGACVASISLTYRGLILRGIYIIRPPARAVLIICG